MMQNNHYDVLIIGSGPGGEGAAMKLVKSGKRVAIVEKHVEVGGGCTHWGTIPSKTLRHVVQQVADYRQDPIFRQLLGRSDITYRQLLSATDTVVCRQTRMRENFYHRNQVDIISGSACFVDAHTIEVTMQSHRPNRYTADRFVIAVGSKPYHPPDVDFNHPLIHDSDTILQPGLSPRSIIIYGAGVIGCEYASIFASFGIKTNLVNTRRQLLAFLDDEITDALGYHLRHQGVVIRHNEVYERVESNANDVTLHLQSGKRIRGNILLWANGRSGNTAGLNLELLGIEPDQSGRLTVNENYQTSQPHIYAAGDVIGFPSLASASYDQGRFAATHIATDQCDSRLIEHIPSGIYTNPEISSVGPTERELTDAKVPYEVGRAFFRSIARAQITGQTVGMIKLLFHLDTHKILGIHCFGHQAAEIVHIGQAIMSQTGNANRIEYFVETTFNYPTMAEAYRVAALNGLNRLELTEDVVTQ